MSQRLAVLLILTLAPAALAGGFSLAIGNPVAGQDFRAKNAAFVVRTEGCAEPAKAQVSGVAEGIVNGARRSVPLKLLTLPAPGVYAVQRQWPSEGVWVVSLTGSYSGATTSAIVPIGQQGFIRESSKFYPRSATAAEIEASLKELTR